MKRIVMLVSLLGVVAMLGGCPPRGPAKILTDQPQAYGTYRYVNVAKDSSNHTAIETMVDRKEIVTRFASGGEHVAYVVRDGASKAVFEKVPFKPLEKATLTVHVARVSDINGWGTEVNGEIHRVNEVKLEFTRAQLSNAFALLQRLETAPLETIAATWPGSLDGVTTTKEVTLFERGYVLAINATLVTGNPFDKETLVDLYGMSQRSGYTRL